MYVAGNVSDFASRLHQLPSGAADITSFINEGNNYIVSGAVVPLQVSGKWEKEARLAKFRFSSAGADLTTQLFSASNILMNFTFATASDGSVNGKVATISQAGIGEQITYTLAPTITSGQRFSTSMQMDLAQGIHAQVDLMNANATVANNILPNTVVSTLDTLSVTGIGTNTGQYIQLTATNDIGGVPTDLNWTIFP